MCANHYLGPESHSVHTMKSTKIVVEENSTCNDVEVDDLLKRARQQRASLAEILTEKSIEKCDTQPEGTLKSPTSSFFFHLHPFYPIFPSHPQNWNESDRNIYYLSLWLQIMFSLTHYHFFISKIQLSASIRFFAQSHLIFSPPTQHRLFFSIIHRKIWQKLTLKNKTLLFTPIVCK